MTKAHHEALTDHLYPGDGKEAVCLALCGRQRTPSGQERLLIRKVIPIPYESCSTRTPDRVIWDTSLPVPLIEQALKGNYGIIKIHSHPAGYRDFSEFDDISDKSIFNTILCALDDGRPHASLIMLPDGELVGRGVLPDLNFVEQERITIVGDQITFFGDTHDDSDVPSHGKRTAQAYGDATYNTMRKLRIGVAGASGTGSLIIEQLHRSGVGEIVILDPKLVEDKNLNRIIYTTVDDVEYQLPKVEVLKNAIEKSGLGTKITAIHGDLFNEEVIREFAACDIVVGSMDTAEGRHILNRLAAFYIIPYFDVGVSLTADGNGNIEAINGGVHYLTPGGSSLLNRGVITQERIRADALFRSNPEEYAKQRQEGYIQGVNEDKPAVMPVNMFFSGLTVMEILARIHGHRYDNSDFAQQIIRVDEAIYTTVGEGQPCQALSMHLGKGDTTPILDMVI